MLRIRNDQTVSRVRFRGFTYSNRDTIIDSLTCLNNLLTLDEHYYVALNGTKLGRIYLVDCGKHE